MIICTVKDVKSGLYHKPFAIDSCVNAEREFRSVIQGKVGKSIIKDYPEDFQLEKVAEFCDKTGKITVDNTVIAKGKDIDYWEPTEIDKLSNTISKNIDKAIDKKYIY